MYDIDSIDGLIEALGGPSVLGETLGISQEAVSNWIVRQAIPGGWHVQLYAMACREGLTVNPRVFRLTEKDVEGLFRRRPKKRVCQPAA